jgi:hypothetical protein
MPDIVAANRMDQWVMVSLFQLLKLFLSRLGFLQHKPVIISVILIVTHYP